MIGLLLLLLQAPPPAKPRIITGYSMGGSAAVKYAAITIAPPLSLTEDATGQAQLTGYVVSGPVGPQGPPGKDGNYAFGPGFLRASVPSYPDQIEINTAMVPTRVAPPVGPGPCGLPIAVSNGVSNLTSTAAWAADSSWLYMCVAKGDGFAWARTALVTEW